MTDPQTAIPSHIGQEQHPVLSAVRRGTGTDPAEFIAVIDCFPGGFGRSYATVLVSVWPDRVETNMTVFDLSWIQALQSMAERAGIPWTPLAEVVVFVREPAAADNTIVFIDGNFSPTKPLVAVTTHVVHLDEGDEDSWWMVTALRDLDHLSPAAQAQIKSEIYQIATRSGVDLEHLIEEYDNR
jgi:hypothetical protein